MLHTRIIVTAAIIFSSLSFSMGQTPATKFKIDWIKNIPDPNVKEKKTPLKIIEGIIFGHERLNLSKPVDIITLSSDEGWILSQGMGEIIKYKGSTLSRVKIRNNKHRLYKSLVSGEYIKDLGLLFSDSADDMVYLLDKEGDLSFFCKEGILLRPTGVAFNKKSQEIWVVESGGHRISIFNKEGGLLKIIGGRGTEPGQFNFPTHIDIDDEGRVFIVDAMNFRIQIFDHKGVCLSSFGEHGDASGKFARPKGIAVDREGNIYVADALFNTIQIFNKEGIFLYYFGRKGSGKGEFVMPSGLQIDDNGYIYVSDSYNNRIQVFKLTSYN